jgi:hypothetical protein
MANAAASSAAPTPPVYPKYLPARLIFSSTKQVLLSNIPPSIIEQRSVLIRWLQYALVENVIGMGFGRVKSGVAKVTFIVNLMLFVMTLLGLHGSLRLSPIALAFHATAMVGLCSVFFIYICIIALVGTEKWYLYIIAFTFIVIDAFVSYHSVLIVKALMALEKALGTDAPEMRAINAPPAAPTIAVLSRTAPANSSAAAVGRQLTQERQAALEQIDTSDAPSQFSCPISLSLMSDPVIAEDGHSYERANIVRWFGRKATSPKTNAKIGKKLVPNHSLKSQIIEYIEAKSRAESQA